MSISVTGPESNLTDVWGLVVYSIVSDGTKFEVNCIGDILSEVQQRKKSITDN